MEEKDLKNKNEFNLIPQEVYAKRERQKKRLDMTLLLSFVLPLLGISLSLIFFIAHLVIKADYNRIQQRSEQVDTELLSFQEDKEINAMLVLKTNLLQEVVEGDVNPENFFNIVQQTVDNSGRNLRILSYGKDPSGHFSISIEADNIEDVTDMTRIFRNHERLNSVELISTDLKDINDNNKLIFELSFEVIDN